MMQGDASAIANTIRQLLPNPSPVVRVLAYRDEASLEALWGLSSGSGSGDVEKGPLVLIDDDRISPLMADRMGAHLSALDWALLHCAADDVGAGGSIIVLDLRMGLRPRVFDTDRSYLTAHVHYFAPSRFGLDQLDRFVACLGNLVSVERRDDEAATFFRTRWLASLAMADTRAGHHEMNNSLAPLLLALGDKELESKVAGPSSNWAGFDPGNPDSMSAFTRHIMLKAIRWASPGSYSPIRTLDCTSWRPPSACGEVRLLLLDDQADEGWIPIIVQLLGLEDSKNRRGVGPFTEVANNSSGLSLWVASDGLRVLEKIADHKWAVGERLRLTSTTNEAEKNWSEVLFLDLRLYSKSEAAELDFLRAVAKSYAAATGNGGPAWQTHLDAPGFLKGAHYLEALTCLAKLICEVDFTFPIVVWSSTGQRRVTEFLKVHRNVYTAIEKPRLDAYAASAKDLQESFQAAAEEALQWAGRAATAAHYTSAMLWNQSVFAVPDPQNAKHVEVYIDESSVSTDPNFTVGALVVYYPSENVADQIHTELNNFVLFSRSVIKKNKRNEKSFARNIKELIVEKQGIVFTGPNRLPKKLDFGPGGYACLNEESLGIRKIGSLRGLVAEPLASILKNRNAEAMFFRIKSTTPLGIYEIDGRYPTVLGECLKLLFGFFLRGRDRTVSVYIATKQSVVAKGADADDIFLRFGPLPRERRNAETNSEEYIFDSMTNHSAFLPVIDAHQFARGRDGGDCPKLRYARAVTLSYLEQGPNAAHYELQLLRDVSAALKKERVWINPEKVLNGARRVTAPTTPRAWRHLHYFADDMLERGALGIYQSKGAIAANGVFTLNLQSQGASRSNTLADIGRALIWNDFEQAASLYFEDVLVSVGLPHINITELEKFVGSQLRAAAADRGIALRMWLAVLKSCENTRIDIDHAQHRHETTNSLSNSMLSEDLKFDEITTEEMLEQEDVDSEERTDLNHVSPEMDNELDQAISNNDENIPIGGNESMLPVSRDDVYIVPFSVELNQGNIREILNSICICGWTGRPVQVDAGVLFRGARRYLERITPLLPVGVEVR